MRFILVESLINKLQEKTSKSNFNNFKTFQKSFENVMDE